LLDLARLLDARVEVADDGLGRNDDLAVELQHEPKHPVGARVLRPHVDGHRFRAQFRHIFPLAGLKLGPTYVYNPSSTNSQITCRIVRCTSCTRAVDASGTFR